MPSSTVPIRVPPTQCHRLGPLVMGPEIAERLKPLLLLRGVQLPHKQTTCEALDLYAAHQGLDFADALEIAHMQRLGLTEIYSYDKHFDRFKGHVRRVEP